MPSLRALHEAGHEIQLVITQPDKPGHRMKVTPPPVKVAAQELGLEVYQPERIRDPEAVERIRRLEPDLLVVVAYGQIIPPSVLGIPKYGAVNVHASVLPRHRGAAPVAHAILAGDRETGVTIMRMDEQLDHGPILAARTTVIAEGEDAVTLTARLAEIGAGAACRYRWPHRRDRGGRTGPRSRDAGASIAARGRRARMELGRGRDRPACSRATTVA